MGNALADIAWLEHVHQTIQRSESKSDRATPRQHAHRSGRPLVAPDAEAVARQLHRSAGHPQEHYAVLPLAACVGDSKNSVRGYCLDIPRFEESLNNETQHNTIFEERGI